ncbi:MAG: chromosome segregation ATPase [Halieaceae bacterium]|jgi:chromosome segregation ATPase
MSKDDDLSPIPSISARRDSEGAAAAVPRPRGGSRSASGKERVAGSGKPGLLSGVLLFFTLLLALAACAWVWQLQEQLMQAEHVLERYETRIADLEDRLADTDEGLSQNTAVQAAKIRELDAEVRKLWDNVWKRSKERFGVLEASSKRFDKEISANAATLGSTRTDLAAAQKSLVQLQSVGGDLERLMTTARSSQAEVERVADTLNRINLELAKLNKRVAGNEGWIGAINAFRQSTNASISQLQARLRELQGPTGT